MIDSVFVSMRKRNPILSREADKQDGLASLRKQLESYYSISDQTWEMLSLVCHPIHLKKKTLLLKPGDIPSSFAFVHSGLLRAYTSDSNGSEYNKIFFAENSFPGAMVALLTASASRFALEALEDSFLLQIDYKQYRRLLNSCEDLKWFHILYIEKHWIVEKEQREIALVQNSASERYLDFKAKHANLLDRIPQFHIASHLGITPTQLSRIRKQLNNDKEAKNQPM